ncbi:MAG: GNAT family N-acetyltransferase [Candidatus Thorarchaeota archaeon]|jgi:ribosomal protein S18 acetylase RimI-like enzyme
MKLKMRDYHWDEDFEKGRQFFIDIWKAGPLYRNWIPSTLENMRYGPGGTLYNPAEEDEYIKFWEDPDSKIIAITIVKPSGGCWIHIHPDHLEVERDLILWIEEQRKKTKKDLSEKVACRFVIEEDDASRIALYEELGYENTELEGASQVYNFEKHIPDYQLPDGYSVRHAEIIKEWEKYRTVQMSVFTHLKDMGRELLENYSKASFYVTELDLVAVDPEGNFAAFCTGRIDPVSRIAELEPVGTHPDHRKKGLGKAVIFECLKRLKKYDPPAIVILGAAATEGANRLYESVGFVNKGLRYQWSKRV